MNSRYILRAAAGAQPSGEALALLLQQGRAVQVLDQSPRMLLVCGDAAALAAALQACNGWQLMPETTTPRPDPRPRVRKGATGD